MEQIPVDLSAGGMVAVLLGNGFDCPDEFRYHPQVQIIDSTHVDAQGIAKMMPDNTKIAITTRNVSPAVFAAFKMWCQRHRIAYLPRSTPGAIGDELKRMLAHKPVVDVAPEPRRNAEPVATLGEAAKVAAAKTKKAIAPHGAIAKLVEEEIDLKKGTSEEARRLFALAKHRGIVTTLGSLQEAIRKRKRKAGVGDIPMSVSPEAERLSVLQAFDFAMEALQKGRAYVENADAIIAKKDKRISDLEARIGLMKEAFAAMPDDE